ncbi:MAG: translocation/assembly module TamB [Bacteroidetes bacterium]|nr:translocation/assembly module TamB [Bacteroidota bacterium]
MGSFQTWAAKKVAERISEELGAPVTIGKLKIRFFDRATVEQFYVEDLHGDTLLFVDKLEANFDDVYLGFSHFDFDYVLLKNGQFNVRQFEGEEDLNIQFILDKINPPRDKKDTVKSAPPELFFWNVDLENVDFTYEFRNGETEPYGRLDEDFLRIRDIQAHLERFLIIDDSLSGDIRNMSFVEANGFQVKNFSTEFIVAYTTMDFANLKLESSASRLEGKFHFDYDSYGELGNFIEEVQMRGSIREASIDMNELAYFAPELEGLHEKVKISGDFKGRVDHLIGRNVELNFLGNTHFKGNFGIQGLPDTDLMTFQIDAKDIQTFPQDLRMFPLYPFTDGEKLDLPSEMDALGEIHYTGKFSGKLDNVRFDGVLLTDVGDVDSHISLRYDEKAQDYAYLGDFSTPNVDLSDLIHSNPQPGVVSMQARVNGIGFSPDKFHVNLSGSSSEFNLDNYTFTGIEFDGELSSKTYDGRLKINDRNLRLAFNGLMDMSKPRTEADFFATIDYANLSALGLVAKDSILSVSTELNSGFTGNSIDELIGQIELSNTLVKYGKTKYNFDDILLEAGEANGKKKLDLLSDIADIHLNGNYQIEKLPESISQVLNSFLPSYNQIKVSSKNKLNDQSFDYNISIKDLSLISALFFPDIRLDGLSAFYGRFDSGNNLLRLDGKVPNLNLAGVDLINFNTHAASSGNQFSFTAGAAALHLGDSVRIDHVSLESETVTDQIDFALNWASRNGLDSADARLNAQARFEGSGIDIEILPSLILIQDTLWKVNEDNLIAIDTGLVEFKNLSFVHDKEFIRIDGAVSKNQKDELDIILDNFQLSNLNPFIGQEGLELQGSTKGIVTISDILKKPFFKTDLDVKGIFINGDLIGDGKIVSKWDRETERILLDAELLASGVPKLDIQGYYIPSRKDNNMDIDVSMNNIQLKLFQPYLDDLFSDINGLADGKLKLTGSLFKPVAEGKIILKRTAVTVGFLNTRYFLAHEFKVSKNSIEASGVQLTDEKAHTGTLDLKINHKNFDDFNFDITIHANNLMALNTDASQSDLFYGTAYASGTFRASGPIDNLVMNISAKTEKGTTFYLPLTGTSDVGQQDFITFVTADEEKLTTAIPKNVFESKGYEINFNLEVTPDAEALLLFDPKVGDMIRGSGSGNLRLEVTEAGEFNIYGDYSIITGDYLFTLQNVINKKFVVQKGGQISFNGDPYDADINLTAIYKVRTSLYNLVKNIDSSEAAKRTIDVDAVMHLTDKLMQPTITFDIVLPNADQDSKTLLESQITSEDELNRQIFALVMFRNFWPNQGGASDAGGLGGVGSNVGELLSSQLSNMLSQFSDDVNIGVNYAQGNADTRDQVSVNLSTQIFNDRVTIDGNVGTGGTATSTNNTSNMVGEFNIEVKITESGDVRIRVFNRSNQYLLVTNDVPYTQGVGLFYRKESETFGDLFKRKN